MNLDIPYFSLLLLVAFLLEYNVDEKNMQNIEAKASIKISLYQPPPPRPRPPPQKKKKKKESGQNLDPAKKFDSHRKFRTT